MNYINSNNITELSSVMSEFRTQEAELKSAALDQSDILTSFNFSLERKADLGHAQMCHFRP